MGNDNVTASPSGTFQAGEGLLNIAANKQEQFEALVQVIGCAHLATDSRFATRAARLTHRAALKAEIEAALATKAAVDWWPLLTAAGVPAGPVYTVPQALAHPQVARRGMVATFPDAPGVGRDIQLLRTGIKLDGHAPAVSQPPPQLGQHTREILAELGCDDAQVQALLQEGAL